jgi:hypothetical protein
VDGSRFDALTRRLATSPFRRSLLGGIGALILTRSTAVAAPSRTTICHHGDAGIEVITVASSALAAHYAHGDVPYTNCCSDGDCAANATCENGTCTPLECPPFTTPIDHACQHPCATWQGHCADPGSDPVEHNCNCVATAAGDALCLTGADAGFGIDVCTTTQDCLDDPRSAGQPGYQCLRNGPENLFYICHWNPSFCTDWSLL